MNICKAFLSSVDENILEKEMIKCNLSRIMGEKKLKISDVSRDTGINRGTLTRLYQETAERIDLEVMDQLCIYLECEVGELFQRLDN
jgi:putative transcriptional regulator